MSLTTPSTPPPPQNPRPPPLPDTAALPAASLRLPPSPVSSPSSSPSSLPLPLPPPRITITLNNRTMPWLPWRPCNITRARYNRAFLAPPPCQQADHAKQQLQKREYSAQLRCETSEGRAQRQAEDLSQEISQGSLLADFGSLRPIARELVRWRCLTFYDLDAAAAEEHEALATILTAPVDWSRTWAMLQAQQARYQVRICRTLGLLPERWNVNGLDVLRAVHRAAADTGVGREQLMLAVEAFASRGSVVRRFSVQGLVEMKEWGGLAGVLLMDREDLTQIGERGGVWDAICARREEVVRRYFSVLDYEDACSGFGLCCFPSCGKWRVVYRLSRRENAMLDGSLELQGQLVHAVSSPSPGSRQRESEEVQNEKQASGERAPEPRAWGKSVRIRLDGEHNRAESVSRASWDSEEERQKRRRERREFHFGKEEKEAYEQREEQERKRRQSLERVTAANAKWIQEYADC